MYWIAETASDPCKQCYEHLPGKGPACVQELKDQQNHEKLTCAAFLLDAKTSNLPGCRQESTPPAYR